MSIGLARRKTRFAHLLVALLTCVQITHAAENQAQQKQKPLVFGFLPAFSTAYLLKRFTPIADYLSKKAGREIRIETAPDYRVFLHRTNVEKRYDIIFTAPHFYYLAEHEGGYHGLVRVALPKLRALIVVPKKSNIKTVRELAGHTLSTVDPLALGTYLVRDQLKKAGLDPDKDLKLIPNPTHNASLLAAYRGNTDAASLMVPPYKRASKEIRNSMRILATTIGTPHMAFATAGRMDSALRNKLKGIMLGFKQDPEGAQILKKLKWPGFVPIEKGDYDSLRSVVTQMTEKNKPPAR